ncbi:MAG: hypothetical protein M0R17_03235 [Candidatus Omnitrophica bacterium]|jgi:hypothetical protein|nr:hypothetical protein [Candidatus Omnitrophota bacterium]
MSIIQGLWKESHLDLHKRMFDNLVELIEDLQNASRSSKTPIDIAKKEDGNLDLSKITVEYLLKWSLLNASKQCHEHIETNL